MADWNLNGVAAWLLREGWKMANRRLLFEQVAGRLLAANVPLWRMAAYIPTLHPEWFADAFFWRRSTGRAEYQQADHAIRSHQDFINSPLQEVARTGRALRRRLAGPGATLDFPFLREMAGQGGTDHYIVPVYFTDRKLAHLSLTTDAPDGFSDAHIQIFDDLGTVFEPIIEAFATRMIGERLLDTYVGRNAGQRVLAGQIERGSGETISAAIWYCDLRGFTALTEKLPRDQLIATLNAYFDCMGEAIERHKGEVLKFIGDAMLAIFPTEGDGAAACVHAFEAARESVVAMETLNRKRRDDGAEALAYGIALHIGEVMYGNIGTRHRLDFTVIGPAVNFASRLQTVCRDLGKPIVLSAPVAQRLAGRVKAIGAHPLRGIAGDQDLFEPA